MSVIVFIICLISCIASIIGYLRRKYKWRSRFMQSNRKLNHYDKRSPYDIYTRDIDIDAPNPYNVYKLFVGQNKNSDYQQREHDYHWYRFDRYELYIYKYSLVYSNGSYDYSLYLSSYGRCCYFRGRLSIYSTTNICGYLYKQINH